MPIVTYIFFFFQAEDGIRDVAVTGVQTCALPISRPRRCDGAERSGPRRPFRRRRAGARDRGGASGGARAWRPRPPLSRQRLPLPRDLEPGAAPARRRVRDVARRATRQRGRGGARRGAAARAAPRRDGPAAGRDAGAPPGPCEREGQEPRGPRAPRTARGHRRDGGRERGSRRVSVRVYNTLTRKKEEFVPLTPGHVRIYACGVTVYDLSHVDRKSVV